MVQWADSVGSMISPINLSSCPFASTIITDRVSPSLTSANRHPGSEEEDVKLLDVIIDNKLTFVKHAKTVQEADNLKMNILRIFRGHSSKISRCTLTKVARALIIPSMLYGSESRSRGEPPVLKILTCLYNEAYQICSGAFKSSPVVSMLEKCHCSM